MIKSLSNRENEVVGEIAKGFSIKEIAIRLFLSPYTVDTHIKRAKRKTGARSLSGLTRIFILSLDNPKKFFAALLFLIIQLTSIINFQSQEVRRRPRLSRRAKYSQLSRRNIKSC